MNFRPSANRTEYTIQFKERTKYLTEYSNEMITGLRFEIIQILTNNSTFDNNFVKLYNRAKNFMIIPCDNKNMSKCYCFIFIKHKNIKKLNQFQLTFRVETFTALAHFLENT